MNLEDSCILILNLLQISIIMFSLMSDRAISTQPQSFYFSMKSETELLQYTLDQCFKISLSQSLQSQDLHQQIKYHPKQQLEEQIKERIINIKRKRMLVELTDMFYRFKPLVHQRIHNHQYYNDKSIENHLTRRNHQVSSPPKIILQITDSIYDQVTESLRKVQRNRTILQSLMKRTHVMKRQNLSKSKKANMKRKNIKRAILELNKLKQIVVKAEEVQSEQQAQDIRSQLTKIPYIVAPCLVQKILSQLAQSSIFQQGKPLQISNYSNLQYIIDQFMTTTDKTNMNKKPKKQNGGLYNLCKNYLKLSLLLHYLPLGSSYYQNQLTVSQLCLRKITMYVSRCSYQITFQEYEKVRSIAQSNRELAKFFESLVTEFQKINLMELQQRIDLLEDQLKAVKQGDINDSLALFIKKLEDQDFIESYRMIQQRKWIYKQSKARQMCENFLIRILRILYFPIVYLLFMVIAGRQETKEGRRYQKVRLMHRHIDIYKKFFNNKEEQGQIQMSKNSLRAKTPQIPNKETLMNGKFIREVNEYFAFKVKESHMKFHEFNDTAIEYNQKFGGIILYFINKLSLVYRNEEKDNRVDEYINFWVEIISELCFGTLYQAESRYPLKDLMFFKERILVKLQEKSKTQVTMDLTVRNSEALLEKINKCKKKFQGYEGEQDYIYMQLMKLNMKTCRYFELMRIARMLGVEIVEQLTKGHKAMYYSIFK